MSRTKGVVLVLGALAVLLAQAGVSHAALPTPNYAGYAVGSKKVLVGFSFHAPGCPGPHCFDHHTHIIGFGPVGYGYPACPELLDGVSELQRPITVGTNGSFEASGPGTYPGEKVSVGGRFLDEGRRARGWFIVDNGGCLTARTRWTANLGG